MTSATSLICDSHFHSLEMCRKGLDPAGLLTDPVPGYRFLGLDAGIHPEDFDERQKLLAHRPDIFLAVGLHPNREWPNSLNSLADCLRNAAAADCVRAVGETGLDFYRDSVDAQTQTARFGLQLELAQELGLPVIIHNRQADRAVLDMLHHPPYSGVMHCFGSSAEIAKKCIDLGLYVSFAGNITYKKADTLREAARAVPRDRLLLETDAPYLAPEPVRGRPNHPGNIIMTYRFTAELVGCEFDHLCRQVAANFLRLFGE